MIIGNCQKITNFLFSNINFFPAKLTDIISHRPHQISTNDLKMNFLKNIKLNSMSRLICSTNSLRLTRNVATRRKAPELPLQRGGEQMKVSGFGKFLMVRSAFRLDCRWAIL
jgi:hypothetical protein